MYEAMQNKEKVSRRIKGGGTQQRGKVEDSRMRLYIPKNASLQLKYNSCLQRTIEKQIHKNWKKCLKNYFGKINYVTRSTNGNQLNSNAIQEWMLNSMYYRAMGYIKESVKGLEIYNKINDSNKKIIVEMCNPEESTSYSYTEEKIYWNPFEFIIFEDDLIEYDNFVDWGLISPASILLHEMGHVAQHIEAKELYENLSQKGESNDELVNLVYYTYPEEGSIVEFDNVISNEMPFNKEKNEPVRRRYDAATVIADSTNRNLNLDSRIIQDINRNIIGSVVEHTNVEHRSNVYKERETHTTLLKRYNNYLNDPYLVIDSVNYQLHLINHEVYLLEKQNDIEELNRKKEISKKKSLFNKIKGIASKYLESKKLSSDYVNIEFKSASIFL